MIPVNASGSHAAATASTEPAAKTPPSPSSTPPPHAEGPLQRRRSVPSQAASGGHGPRASLEKLTGQHSVADLPGQHRSRRPSVASLPAETAGPGSSAAVLHQGSRAAEFPAHNSTPDDDAITEAPPDAPPNEPVETNMEMLELGHARDAAGDDTAAAAAAASFGPKDKFVAGSLGTLTVTLNSLAAFGAKGLTKEPVREALRDPRIQAFLANQTQIPPEQVHYAVELAAEIISWTAAMFAGGAGAMVSQFTTTPAAVAAIGKMTGLKVFDKAADIESLIGHINPVDDSGQPKSAAQIEQEAAQRMEHIDQQVAHYRRLDEGPTMGSGIISFAGANGLKQTQLLALVKIGAAPRAWVNFATTGVGGIGTGVGQQAQMARATLPVPQPDGTIVNRKLFNVIEKPPSIRAGMAAGWNAFKGGREGRELFLHGFMQLVYNVVGMGLANLLEAFLQPAAEKAANHFHPGDPSARTGLNSLAAVVSYTAAVVIWFVARQYALDHQPAPRRVSAA